MLLSKKLIISQITLISKLPTIETSEQKFAMS